MKKGLLIFAALFTFGYAANAQDEASSGAGTNAGMVRFGPKAGLNFTNFTGDIEDTDGKTGFYIGAFVDCAISDKFHLQPELLYSAEGADDLAIDYIRIPVMAKFYVTDGFNLQLGPEVAFKVAADEVIDDSVSSTDFGLGFGAAYDLPMGLIFEARYNLGLMNISEDDDFDVKNTNFQIGLGYKF